MKFGLRKPSIKKMISSRTSPKRIIKNSLGISKETKSCQNVYFVTAIIQK